MFTIRNSVVWAVVDNDFQAAPQVALIVRGGPDGGHIDTPELVGYGDLQEPGSATSAGFAVTLQQLVFASHPPALVCG